MIYIENIKVTEIYFSKIIKEIKRKYYNDYFRTNLKNIKNTWKGIKSIISLKCKDSDTPKNIKDKDTFLTAPKDIANLFKINFAHKSFNNFLKNQCNESIFIKPCTNKGIIDITSDLGSNEATGPNSSPIKIMKLAKDSTANNLTVLFNLSFSSGVFPVKL